MSALAVDVLTAIYAAGGTVRIAGEDRLKVSAPVPLPNVLMDRLRAVKPDVRSLLSAVPADWIAGVASLDAESPPPPVRPVHWSAFVIAAKRFLDSWATKAIDLGWTDLDLFGADASRPEIAWLNSGLLWSSPSHSILDLRDDRAILRTLNGSPQTFYRTPHLRARALPWEISHGSTHLRWELSDPSPNGLGRSSSRANVWQARGPFSRLKNPLSMESDFYKSRSLTHRSNGTN
jgi:hypothetical protein